MANPQDEPGRSHAGDDRADAARSAGTPPDAEETDQPDTTREQAGEGGARTFTIDTDSPVADTGDEGVRRPGGTTPAWWDWVGRHRKLVAIVAAVVVVGVVATLVTVSALTPGPSDVVQRYLDAIHRGDTEAALEIAGEPEGEGHREFLDERAMVDDWQVDAVVERPQGESNANVDVTFSAKGVSRQGRFGMVKDENGWKMEEPFVNVALTVGGLDGVELGGVRVKKTSARYGVVSLVVFPGVYELYPSLAKRVSFEPKLFVAAPPDIGGGPVQVSVTPTLTDAGKKEAQKSVNAHIDGCVKKPSLDPPGCPFDARRSDIVEKFGHVSGIVWTLVSYPEARFATGRDGGLQLVTRKVGTIQLTATGTPENDGPPANFTMTCEFGLADMKVAMTMDGFVTQGASRTGIGGLTTVCF